MKHSINPSRERLYMISKMPLKFCDIEGCHTNSLATESLNQSYLTIGSLKVVVSCQASEAYEISAIRLGPAVVYIDDLAKTFLRSLVNIY